MSNTQQPPTPHEPKAWLFHHAIRLYTTMVPPSVRSFMKLLLFQVSPDIPVSLTSAWGDASLNAVFTVAVFLTFIMCFCVVLVWSSIAGTLTGSDPSRLYFLKDWVNLLNYILLCPLYIGFGAVLIATTVRGWAELKQLTSADRPASRTADSHVSVFLLLLAILAAAYFVNVKFMTENMNPSIYPRTYWFMEHDRSDGSRVIGAFGFYYGLLNFCLLLFSLFVAGTFLSLFRLLVQIGDGLDLLSIAQPVSTEMLPGRLTTFTKAYLAGKLVVAAYMANALAWKTSQAQHSTNLVVYGGALTLFGVVFLTIPRYYVELQWFRLRAARRGGTDATVPEYEDLRPWEVDFVGVGRWKTKVVVHVLDSCIIGGFLLSFWL